MMSCLAAPTGAMMILDSLGIACSALGVGVLCTTGSILGAALATDTSGSFFTGTGSDAFGAALCIGVTSGGGGGGILVFSICADDDPSVRVETLSRCLIAAAAAGSVLGGLNLDRLLKMSWSLFLKPSDTLKGLCRYCSIGTATLTAAADDAKGTDSLASDDDALETTKESEGM